MQALMHTYSYIHARVCRCLTSAEMFACCKKINDSILLLKLMPLFTYLHIDAYMFVCIVYKSKQINHPLCRIQHLPMK